MGDYINSRQARFDGSHISCGVVEVHHLPKQSPAQTAFAIMNHLYHKANGRPGAFVIFSDVVGGEDNRGELLALYLRGIGANIFQSEKQVNPKTGNVICLWCWTVDHDRFRKIYSEEYVNRVVEN